jgi:hypothetical protein
MMVQVLLQLSPESNLGFHYDRHHVFLVYPKLYYYF